MLWNAVARCVCRRRTCVYRIGATADKLMDGREPREGHRGPSCRKSAVERVGQAWRLLPLLYHLSLSILEYGTSRSLFIISESRKKKERAFTHRGAAATREKEREKTDSQGMDGRTARRYHTGILMLLKEKKEKKTDNPREGWEDGTPPPHRACAVRESSVV